MAASTSRINIEFLSKGDSEVNKAFKRLGGETRRLNRDFQSLSKKSLIQVINWVLGCVIASMVCKRKEMP